MSYPALMAERLHATVGKIRLVLLLFGGALLLISLILVSNTIRLAIYSKRYLINTMKLVGATKWFIMRPFLGSSVTQASSPEPSPRCCSAWRSMGSTKPCPNC